MTIIRNSGVEKLYSKGEKMPLYRYKSAWVRFFPSSTGSWDGDFKDGKCWPSFTKESHTILVPKEFT